jgi:hypothetical protein
MFPDHVFQERQELAEKIAKAPRDYRDNNAGALLQILWELQKSLALELSVIQGVKQLDLSDATTVHDYAIKFGDYVAQRDFNLERTSCGAIARVYDNQVKALQGGNPTDQQRVGSLTSLVLELGSADRRFTEEIEPVMDHALDALRTIDSLVDSGNLDQARRRQSDFAREYEGELARLKRTIRSMSDVGNQLIEEL